MTKTLRSILSICLLVAIIPLFTGVSQAAGSINYESGECKSYINNLTRKLNNNWFVPDGNNRVTISCVVETDGTPQEVNTSSSSSSKEAEQAANAAFVKAQPFGSLPASAGDKVKLTLEFVSNADPHGDSTRNIKATLSDPKK